MIELNTLKQNKGKESKRVDRGDSLGIRPFSEYNVQTVIRPQVTNPKTFWSKSEDEDFSFESKNIKNTIVEDKVIRNIFKPIRSEEAKVKSMKIKGKQSKEPTKKMEKSIHESLRIQKMKWRSRLPAFWDDRSQESSQKVQTNDFNYYSSLIKGLNQEAADYYCSSKKVALESKSLLRSASDERIYEEKRAKKNAYLEVKESGNKLERISVTEPSSPLIGDYILEVDKKRASSDSEPDSESTGCEVFLKMKKSKSFVEEKESEGYFSLNSKPKLSTLENRHFSHSSSSSCESAYRTRSLQKMPKFKKKLELKEPSKIEFYSKRQNYASQPKKHKRENSDKSQVEGISLARNPNVGVIKKEKFQPLNRDVKTEEDLQKFNSDVFQHLIDVLLQKNRAGLADKKNKEFFTKSLPRNISRRLDDEAFDGETLNAIKSLAEKNIYTKNQQTNFSAKKNNVELNIFPKGNNSAAVLCNVQKRRPDVSGGEVCVPNGHQYFTGEKSSGSAKATKSSDATSEKGNPRGKPVNNIKQCVFRIEDKKLWFEICKAVEKVDAEAKNLNKHS